MLISFLNLSWDLFFDFIADFTNVLQSTIRKGHNALFY